MRTSSNPRTMSRRMLTQGLIAAGSAGTVLTVFSDSALAQAADVLRNSTGKLAEACLHPAVYQDFKNWEQSCSVVWNNAAVNKATFHDSWSSPAMYGQNYSMSKTRYDGQYMGVQNLPQTGTSTYFAPRADFNAAESLEVSSVLKARDIVPIISSNERRPPDGYAQEFSNRFAQIYQQSPPATVSAIYYVRDFCGCTGVPLRGWGYALKAQPNVGRFMIAQIA